MYAVPLAVAVYYLYWLRKRNLNRRPLPKPIKSSASEPKDTLTEDSNADSEGDGLMSEGDIMFPEEESEDE